MCSLLGRILIKGRLCCRQNGNVVTHSWSNYSKLIIRQQCTKPPNPNMNVNPTNGPQKMSLLAKFKAMYKDYWYVLVPVHLVTSLGWYILFYKVATSGLDIGLYLRKLGVGETIVKHITDSGLGDLAVMYALYKLASPIRYAVTLGGATVSINALKNAGYIKPAKELIAQGRKKIKSHTKDKEL